MVREKSALTGVATKMAAFHAAATERGPPGVAAADGTAALPWGAAVGTAFHRRPSVRPPALLPRFRLRGVGDFGIIGAFIGDTLPLGGLPPVMSPECYKRALSF